MSKPNIVLVLPGLEWNQDWLQQNVAAYLNTDWIEEFYSKGIKDKKSLQYSNLLSQYLLDTSFLNKASHVAELENKYVTMISPVFQNMRLHQMSVLCGNE
ncbi:MAG: hypothetical protein N4Q30_08105, partial [Neisseriaceae bacterium]|nr:hypothetical protein [Neisseriaceae bacterium]